MPPPVALDCFDPMDAVLKTSNKLIARPAPPRCREVPIPEPRAGPVLVGPGGGQVGPVGGHVGPGGARWRLRQALRMIDVLIRKPQRPQLAAVTWAGSKNNWNLAPLGLAAQGPSFLFERFTTKDRTFVCFGPDLSVLLAVFSVPWFGRRTLQAKCFYDYRPSPLCIFMS